MWEKGYPCLVYVTADISVEGGLKPVLQAGDVLEYIRFDQLDINENGTLKVPRVCELHVVDDELSDKTSSSNRYRGRCC